MVELSSPSPMEHWAVTKRMRSWMQVAEMSFLRRVAWLTLRDRVRSANIRREPGVELLLLCVERTSWGGSSIWSKCLPGTFLWRFSIQPVRAPKVDPEHTGEITYLILLGKALGSPRRSWKMLLGRGKSGLPCLACCHCSPTPDKWQNMDGWINLNVV